MPALIVLKSLAFLTSLILGEDKSTTLPFRYALPVEIFTASKSVAALPLSSVTKLGENLPTFSLIVTLSKISNSNGLTV